VSRAPNDAATAGKRLRVPDGSFLGESPFETPYDATTAGGPLSRSPIR
jgi:hypothetical protein